MEREGPPKKGPTRKKPRDVNPSETPRLDARLNSDDVEQQINSLSLDVPPDEDTPSLTGREPSIFVDPKVVPGRPKRKKKRPRKKPLDDQNKSVFVESQNPSHMSTENEPPKSDAESMLSEAPAKRKKPRDVNPSAEPGLDASLNSEEVEQQISSVRLDAPPDENTPSLAGGEKSIFADTKVVPGRPKRKKKRPPEKPLDDQDKSIFVEPENPSHMSTEGEPTRSEGGSMQSELPRSMQSESPNEHTEGRKYKFPYYVYLFLPITTLQKMSLIGTKNLVSDHMLMEMDFTSADTRIFFSFLIIPIHLMSLVGAFIFDGLAATLVPLGLSFLFMMIGDGLLLLATLRLNDTTSSSLLYLGIALHMSGIGLGRPISLIICADQFTLPQQYKQLHKFFFDYFFAEQFGIFLSMVILPYTTSAIGCRKRQYCHPVSFAFLECLQLLVFTIFFSIVMRYFRRRKKPAENYPKTMILSIWYGLNIRCTPGLEGTENWLDNAREKYGKDNVYRTRKFLRLTCVFLACSPCYALEQQHVLLFRDFSRNMDGTLLFCIQLMSSQIGIFSSLMAMLWVFVARVLRYNVFKRIIVGNVAVLIGYLLFYFITRFVDYSNANTIREGYANVRFYNPTTCDFLIQAPEVQIANITVNSMNCTAVKNIYWDENIIYDFKMFTSNCPDSEKYPSNGILELYNQKATGYLFRMGLITKIEDDETRSKIGHPQIRFVTEAIAKVKQITIKQRNVMSIPTTPVYLPTSVMATGAYTFCNNHYTCLRKGVVMTFMVHISHDARIYVSECMLREPHHVSVWWLFPVCIIIALETCLSSQALRELSYIYGPPGLKCTTNASFLIFSETVGNCWIILFQNIFTDFSYIAFSNVVFVILGLVVTIILLAHLHFKKDIEVVEWNK